MDSVNNTCKFGTDAWLELQAFKTRQLNRREKLNRHKDLINGIASNHSQNQAVGSSSTSALLSNNSANSSRPTPFSPQIHNSEQINDLSDQNDNCQASTPGGSTRSEISSQVIGAQQSSSVADLDKATLNLELVECLLLLKLCDVAMKLPIDSRSLLCSINKVRSLEGIKKSVIENLLQKFAHQELITIEEPSGTLFSNRHKHISSHETNSSTDNTDDTCIYVTSADHSKLVEFDKSFGPLDNVRNLLLEARTEDTFSDAFDPPLMGIHGPVPIQSIRITSTQESKDLFNQREDISTRTNSNDSHRLEHDINDASQPDRSNSHKTTLPQLATNKFTPSSSDDVESLLSLSSTKERECKKLGEELLELLSKPTAKERNLLESFRSADGYQVQEFCPKGTKGECRRNNKDSNVCDKLHFKKIIAKHTEESLGDCSFLNTCFHMDSCKYVHYEVDYDDKKTQQNPFKRPFPADTNISKSLNYTQKHDHQDSAKSSMTSKDTNNNKTHLSTICMTGTGGNIVKLSPAEQKRIDINNHKRYKTVLYPPQWIQCDLRFFDMSLLGKFSVVMADPPWDIHMELPYGTMSDDEMRKLNIPALQDEGVIFLWVTGRAMELGRECLALWGYERCDEIIWVKTNQLQRIIRTGRTGHWLNHGKEHCLVGVKGNPKDMNRGLDCDVIVAEVRATSHKPDEIYGIIERLSPGTRKIELFGRAHNVQPNWITLGNQLNGVRLIEQNLINSFKKLNLPFHTGDDKS